MSVKAANSDPYVLAVQQWVNDTYRGKTGYTEIPETGKTGWTTIYALLHALQIELGITATADNFGNTTISKFNQQYPNGVQQQDTEDKTKKNIYGIIQGGLLCKGYSIGTGAPTCNFYDGTGNAIKQLKEDAGINASSSTVTLNIMKALMSMDYFYSYDQSERTQNIITMQRYLNANYEAYTGLSPCDGIYGRNTSKALLFAIQAEEGMPTSVANGNCGPSTKSCLPTIQSSGSYSGTNYNGQSYSSATIDKFKILANIALYFNGFGGGNITSSLMLSAIQSFQSKYGIPQTGNLDYTTWLSLLVSCGNTDRSAIACDCMTKITSSNVHVLKNNNYQYIARYLTNAPGGKDKKITSSEIKVLFSNGIRLFPIFQTSGTYLSYFTSSQGSSDASTAAAAADDLQLQFGTIIYFAVDYDATDAEITSNVLPYFQAVRNSLVSSGKAKYRVGVYGTRNVCTRVCEAGYACSSFVSDMSTGYSGNLGFTIPDNWALDQFATTTISSNGQSIEIDKDGFSGQYKGISQEYSATNENDKTLDGYCRILINMSQDSVPVYERKEVNLPSQPEVFEYNPAGSIIGYIKPHDMYVRYAVEEPQNDNVHKVMFNDGTDVKVGYIREQHIPAGMQDSPTDQDVVDQQILIGHEPFTCVEYVPSSNSYVLHKYADTPYREFYINKPTVCIDNSGNYKETLKKGDYVRINRDNYKRAGSTRPWSTRIIGIKHKGESSFTDYSGFACVGLEYAASGSERAWY